MRKLMLTLALVLAGTSAHADTSNYGRALIESFEDRRSCAYDDGVGILTIGVGHVPNAYERVREDTCWTNEHIDYVFRQDVKEHEGYIDRLVKVSLTQNQYDALSSFVFNVGGPNFANSTMLKKLNKGDYHGAAKEFDRWVYAKGRQLRGLITRRRIERELFESDVKVEPFTYSEKRFGHDIVVTCDYRKCSTKISGPFYNKTVMSKLLVDGHIATTRIKVLGREFVGTYNYLTKKGQGEEVK